MRCENRSRTCGTRPRWNAGLSPSLSRLSGNTLKRTNAQTPSYTPQTRRTTRGQRRANASSCDGDTPFRQLRQRPSFFFELYPPRGRSFLSEITTTAGGDIFGGTHKTISCMRCRAAEDRDCCCFRLCLNG